jgi:Mn2+/Fe2+ NRAMP family transporter
VLPHIQLTKEYVTALIAVLGTTISPYLFFWQASQEVEEVRNNRGEKPLKRALLQAQEQLGRIRIDTYLGMAFSNIVAFFIILTAAATLHTHGITEISTSAQAATALEPLAGRFAFLLFVCGIVGTGLLAVPVLAASACYRVGEACRWKTSLERKPGEAARFYAAITIATLTDNAMRLHRRLLLHVEIDALAHHGGSSILHDRVPGYVVMDEVLARGDRAEYHWTAVGSVASSFGRLERMDS